MKNFKTTIIAGVIATSIAGCSSSHSTSYEKKSEEAQKVAAEVEQQMLQRNVEWEPISEVVKGNSYHDLSKYRIQRKDERVLPQEFYLEPTINDQDPKKSPAMSVDDFAAMLYQAYRIRLDVSSPDLWILTGADIGDIREGSKNQKEEIGTPVEKNPDVQVSAMSSDSAGDYSALASMLSPQSTSTVNGLSKSRKELKLKPFNFKKGTVKEMLDYVTTMNGLKWRYDIKSNKAFLYVYDTKVFNVVDFAQSVKTKDTTTSSSSQKDDSGGSTRSSTTNTKESTMDPWKDLESNIKSMMSAKGGSVSFDQRNGMITVTDTDTSLIKIGDYIDQLNKSNMQTVTVYYRLIRVRYKESDFKGMNQSFLNQSMESGALGKFSMTANLGSLDGRSASSAASVAALSGGNILQFSNSQFGALMGFLNAVGTAQVSYEDTVEVLNNSTYSSQKAENKEYVDEIQQSSTYGNNNGGQDRITYKKATAIDGTNIYVGARVAQNRVFVQYMITDTDIYGLEPESLNDGAATITKKWDGIFKDANTVMLKNGETRVVNVKQEQSNKTDSQGIGSHSLWFFGGKESSSEERTAIITTITAFYSSR